MKKVPQVFRKPGGSPCATRTVAQAFLPVALAVRLRLTIEP